MTFLLDKVVREVSPGTQIFKVLTYLSFKGASQPYLVAEETGIPDGTVRPALRSLLDMGYVSQREDGSYESKIVFTDMISHLYTSGES